MKHHFLPLAAAAVAAVALSACGKGPSTPATPGLLMGTVVDSVSHAPLAGAKVVAGSADSTATDAAGRFSLSLPQGRYAVQVSKENYYGVAANVPVLSRDTTEIVVYTRLRPWTPGTAMADPNDYRHNYASVLWGGQFYLMGGRQAQSSLDLSSSLTYSPGSNAWPANSFELLTPGRHLSASAVCRDTLYLFGGLSGSSVLNTVLKLNSSSWSATSNPIPAGLYGMSAVTSGDSILLMGGFTGPNAATESVRVYKPSADSAGGTPWSTAANMPAARAGMSCAAAGGVVYLFGGVNSGGSAQRSSYRYDPSANSWTYLADMPADRAYAACAAASNMVYVIGGLTGSTVCSSTYRYNPAANSWTAMEDMPLARYGAGAAAYGGRIYVVGGFDGTNSLGAVEVYNPAADLK